jgi:sugar lactone lactonase YvrE
MIKKLSALVFLTTLAACGTGGSNTVPLPITTPLPPQMLWVSNDGANAIQEFSLTASGAQTPVATVGGAATGLNAPFGIAFDSAGRLYVAMQGFGAVPPAIRVFAAGATGNATPVQVISGAATTLSQPSGLTIDAAGNIWVADQATQTLDVFASTANGNVAPLRTVSNPAPFGGLNGIAADSAGFVYATESGAVGPAFDGKIDVYPDTASGTVAPTRVITGSATTLQEPTEVTLDGAGEIIVTDLANAVDIFAPSANGNVAPIRRIVGSSTMLSGPQAIASEANGTIHVANIGNSPPVFTFTAGAGGNIAPSATLTSSAFSFPFYMTIH